MSDATDEELMLRYQQGDVRAFEVLLSRHQRSVYNFILRNVFDRAQAEDLLQETFLRVIRGSEAFAGHSSFRTWLFAITRNLCVDASRRSRLRRAQSLDAPLDRGAGSGRGGGEESTDTLLDVTSDRKAVVDQAVIGRQLGERIQLALAGLSDEQREVFMMREVANLSFKEIAEVLGCPENTVKSRMRYALDKLRDSLDEYRDLAQAAQ